MSPEWGTETNGLDAILARDCNSRVCALVRSPCPQSLTPLTRATCSSCKTQKGDRSASPHFLSTVSKFAFTLSHAFLRVLETQALSSVSVLLSSLALRLYRPPAAARKAAKASNKRAAKISNKRATKTNVKISPEDDNSMEVPASRREQLIVFPYSNVSWRFRRLASLFCLSGGLRAASETYHPRVVFCGVWMVCSTLRR